LILNQFVQVHIEVWNSSVYLWFHTRLIAWL